MTRRLTTPTTIWLTGATSGIGRALAEQLVARGHRLIASGRNESALEALQALNSERVMPLALDTTSQEDLAQARAAFDQPWPLQMVILNAGTCEYLDPADYQSSVVEANLTTNVIGTSRCIEAALPALRQARAQGLPATLVIVSSSAWWFPFGRAEGYGASKAALSYLAHALRADLAAEGIEVVTVSPGFVKTPLTDRNDFPMPFLIDADDAAGRIISGLEKGRRDIEFPRRFTWTLRLLGALPQCLIDRMAAAMSRNQKNQQEANQ